MLGTVNLLSRGSCTCVWAGRSGAFKIKRNTNLDTHCQMEVCIDQVSAAKMWDGWTSWGHSGSSCFQRKRERHEKLLCLWHPLGALLFMDFTGQLSTPDKHVSWVSGGLFTVFFYGMVIHWVAILTSWTSCLITWLILLLLIWPSTSLRRPLSNEHKYNVNIVEILNECITREWEQDIERRVCLCVHTVKCSAEGLAWLLIDREVKPKGHNINIYRQGIEKTKQ